MSDIIERYSIRVGGEWAYIYLDEANGVFTGYSSFGNYAYQWRSIGSDTLKEFLRGLNFSYFMGKTRTGYLQFDHEATVDGIKTAIIEQRREGAIDRDDARAAWHDLEQIDAGNSVDRFFDGFCSSNPLMKVYGGGNGDIARERPDGDSRGFWEKIWPEFLKQISLTKEAVA